MLQFGDKDAVFGCKLAVFVCRRRIVQPDLIVGRDDIARLRAFLIQNRGKRRNVGECNLQIVRALFRELADADLLDQLPLCEEAERRRRLLQFGEDMAGEENGNILLRVQRPEQLPHLMDAARIQSVDRLDLIMPPTLCQHGTRVCRCRFYWLHFRCPALPASVSMPAQGSFSDADAVRAIAKKLMQAEAAEPRGVRSRYLASMLLLELREQALADAPEDGGVSSSAEQLCERIKEFVFFHRFSDVKVREIARELGYHEKYLSAVFHRTEGVTLKAYIDAQRCAEAKRLLLESRLTVTEVAYYLNFPDPHSFARFFKTTAGRTATQFREEQSDPPMPRASAEAPQAETPEEQGQ